MTTALGRWVQHRKRARFLDEATIAFQKNLRGRLICIAACAVFTAAFIVAYSIGVYALLLIEIRVMPIYLDDPLSLWPVIVQACIPCLFLPLSVKRGSDIAIWILYLHVYVPTICMSWVLDTNSTWLIKPSVVCVLAGLVILELTRRKAPFKPVEVRGRRFVYEGLLPALVLVGILVVGNAIRWNFDFNYGTVYDRRDHAAQLIRPRSAISYFCSAVLVGLAPLLAIYGTVFRKWHWVGLGILGGVCLYGANGSKSALVIPFVVVLLAGTMPIWRKGIGWIMPFVVAATIALTGVLALLGFLDPLINYTRRNVAVPGILTVYHVQYFSANPPMMLADSAFPVFGKNGYVLGVGNEIAGEYMDETTTQANANIWANGFAQAGWIGLIVASVLAGLILRMVDSMTAGRSLVFGGVICTLISLIWINGSVHTSFLSQGVGAILLFVLFFPKPEEVSARKPDLA